MQRIYLDHAASTPVDPEALKAMLPYCSEKYGNAGSIHSFGQEALAAVDKARETIAKAIGAEFGQIIFTSSATEANNLAIRGAIKAHRVFSCGTECSLAPAASDILGSRPADSRFARDQAQQGCEAFRKKTPCEPKILTSSIEHESVLETCRDLEKEGAEVAYLPVDSDGIVDLGRLRQELDENTILVSVMYVNNHVGTIEPVQEIGRIVKEFRASRGSEYPFFHTDAVQAFSYLDCDVDVLGADLLSLSSHKIYGPKGVGASYIRNKELIKAVISGGGQEFGLRSSTLNTPAIAGFGKAVEILLRDKDRNAAKVRDLRDYFWHSLKKAVPRLELNGPSVESGKRVVSNLNVYFPGQKAADLVVKLDMQGIAVSVGAACSVRAAKPSYVVSVLYNEERGGSSLRFTLGKHNTKEEIEEAVGKIQKIYA